MDRSPDKAIGFNHFDLTWMRVYSGLFADAEMTLDDVREISHLRNLGFNPFYLLLWNDGRCPARVFGGVITLYGSFSICFL
jgi:hypothetical protein